MDLSTHADRFTKDSYSSNHEQTACRCMEKRLESGLRSILAASTSIFWKHQVSRQAGPESERHNWTPHSSELQHRISVIH
ncbi:hypothetical protein CesoFtcFv8_000926 [Champsocephalus esox]|uniref:Uncharacterized protein n=1 Tax=Champsocephalus esox TaxID=159716 RepID=A0AAN8D3P7_9TELE|nr:hypothetical protein CesoFtcFv8_000926 [Champsocephalus esox]